MKCKACNKEVTSKRKTRKFCNDKCKLAYHRKGISVSDSVSNDTVKVSVSTVSVEKVVSVSSKLLDIGINKKLKDYTAQDLYDAIGLYPADTWIKSPEFIELRHRLDTMPKDKLKEQGYQLPNKYA